MTISSEVIRWAAAGLIVVAMTACNTVEVEKFNKLPDSKVDAAYVKSGVDFGRYHSLLAEPMDIYYPDGAEPPSPEELARIRSIFRRNFLAEIGTDFPIVSSPGPRVLRVRASLVDLKTRTVSIDAGQFRGRLGPMLEPGRLTFLMELMDSQSGETLARAADEEKTGQAGSAGDQWSQIDAAAHGWAVAFRAFLDDNLARH